MAWRRGEEGEQEREREIKKKNTTEEWEGEKDMGRGGERGSRFRRTL